MISIRLFTGLFALLLLSSTAAAQPWDAGPFVTGSVGASAINFDTNLDDIGDADHSGFSGRIAAGYWFSRHWGVSLNYAELGDFEQRFDTGTFRGSARSYGASFLGRWPLNDRWALLGKVNLVQSEMDDDGSTGTGFDDLFGKERSLVLPSVEVNYRATENLTLLLEADARGPAAEDVDLGYLGLGVRWQF